MSSQGRVIGRVLGFITSVCVTFIFAADLARSSDLRIAVSAAPTSMDPHFQNINPNNNLASHVFEALTRLDEDATLRPALAESWRAIDATTWEFRLRKGVKFHDGSDLTADDVAWSLSRPGAINTPGGYTTYTQQITSKEVIDRWTIRLKTATAYPLMPNDLSTVFIVSMNATRGVPSADFAQGRGAIGTGPFRFVSFRLGERVELTRFDGYWGEKPVWQNVTMRVITVDASRLAALLAGDVDAIENVPVSDLSNLEANSNYRVFSKVSYRIIFLTLDQGRDIPFGGTVTDNQGVPLAKNPFKDLRVRQAFNKAINRQAIREKVMERLALPTANLVPSPMFGHNAALKVEPFDPPGAKKLLADAGYPKGFGLTIHGPQDRYVNDRRILLTIAQMLASIDIQTKVETMPAALFFTRGSRKEFTVALLGWGSQTGEVSSPLRAILATINPAKGMGAYNYGLYSNSRLDALLEEGLRTGDDLKRKKLLEDAVAVAVNDVALIPLHHQVATWATRKGITYTPRTDERTYAHQFFAR